MHPSPGEARAPGEIADAVGNGDLRSAARLISRIEAADAGVAPVLKLLHARGGTTPIIGLTGPPGAGKSTLVDQLLALYREAGLRVAVLAVDPSSPFSGGAILGDRVRMGRHNTDRGVFIRSMAARGRLGGLALAAADALTVLEAMGWDRILIETVGVGQNEIEIMRHAHTVIIVQTPAGGDAVQAVKAGILEVGDLFVVNKADTSGADQTVAALREAVEFRTHAHGLAAWSPPVLKTEAAAGVGITEVIEAIEAHRQHLQDHPKQPHKRSRAQARALPMPEIESNKLLAQVFLEHAFANRVESALSYLSPDASWWVLGSPERLKVSGIKNRVQIEKLLNGLTRMIPAGMRIVIRGITAEGNRVAIEVESRGTFANGREYHNSYHFLLELRDGLVVSVREYMDTLHLADVLA